MKTWLKKTSCVIIPPLFITCCYRPEVITSNVKNSSNSKDNDALQYNSTALTGLSTAGPGGIAYALPTTLFCIDGGSVQQKSASQQTLQASSSTKPSITTQTGQITTQTLTSTTTTTSPGAAQAAAASGILPPPSGQPAIQATTAASPTASTPSTQQGNNAANTSLCPIPAAVDNTNNAQQSLDSPSSPASTGHAVPTTQAFQISVKSVRIPDPTTLLFAQPAENSWVDHDLKVSVGNDMLLSSANSTAQDETGAVIVSIAETIGAALIGGGAGVPTGAPVPLTINSQ